MGSERGDDGDGPATIWAPTTRADTSLRCGLVFGGGGMAKPDLMAFAMGGRREGTDTVVVRDTGKTNALEPWRGDQVCLA